jgi:hypothetical protein
MNRRLIVTGLAAALLVAAAGALIAAAEHDRAPAFIAGDRPVTEDQIRQKLLSEGYTNVRVTRQGGYFEVTGSKSGATTTQVIEAQTGRLRDEDDDDD